MAAGIKEASDNIDADISSVFQSSQYSVFKWTSENGSEGFLLVETMFSFFSWPGLARQ